MQALVAIGKTGKEKRSLVKIKNNRETIPCCKPLRIEKTGTDSRSKSDTRNCLPYIVILYINPLSITVSNAFSKSIGQAPTSF